MLAGACRQLRHRPVEVVWDAQVHDVDVEALEDRLQLAVYVGDPVPTRVVLQPIATATDRRD